MHASIKHLNHLSAILLFAAVCGQAQAEAPDHVALRSLISAGTGCPGGSVASNVSDDGQSFTLLFDSYIAEVGPDVPYSHKRRNCQLNIDLDVPAGWSYSLLSVDTRGYIALEPGVDALQRSAYYFQGLEGTAGFNTVLSGPSDRNYTVSDVLGLDAVLWSPCDGSRSLNLSTEVRLDNSKNPAGQGLATVDSLDGEFKLIYALQWRRCSASSADR